MHQRNLWESWAMPWEHKEERILYKIYLLRKSLRSVGKGQTGIGRWWQVEEGFTGIHSQTNLFVYYERWLSLTGGVFETKHFMLIRLCDWDVTFHAEHSGLF